MGSVGVMMHIKGPVKSELRTYGVMCALLEHTKGHIT